MLQTHHLTYQTHDKVILQNIDLELEPGQLVAIIGPNGAGKSTLLHNLAGLLQPTRGSVIWNGADMHKTDVKRLATERAILTQKLNVDAEFTLKDIVMMGRYPHFRKQAATTDFTIVEDEITRNHLQHLQNKPFGRLSGGEQQRAHLARAYAQLRGAATGQKLLLLDEPLNNLDIKYQHEVLERASDFAAEGHLVVAVIHDINLAARYAQTVVFMHQGQVLSTGGPFDVITQKQLEQAYEIEAVVETDLPYPQVNFKPETQVAQGMIYVNR